MASDDFSFCPECHGDGYTTRRTGEITIALPCPSCRSPYDWAEDPTWANPQADTDRYANALALTVVVVGLAVVLVALTGAVIGLVTGRWP